MENLLEILNSVPNHTGDTLFLGDLMGVLKILMPFKKVKGKRAQINEIGES